MDDSYLDVSRNEAIMEGNRFLIEGLRERVSTGLMVSTGLKVKYRAQGEGEYRAQDEGEWRG